MDAAHWHLLLNHAPVLGTIFGALLLIAALSLRNGTLTRTSLTVFVLSALVAVPVYLTGEGAEEIVEDIPGVAAESVIEAHESAGLIALIAVGLLGLLALVALWSARGRTTPPRWIGPSALVIALVVSGLFVWTATLGGQINHPEIRGTPTAVQTPDEDDD